MKVYVVYYTLTNHEEIVAAIFSNRKAAEASIKGSCEDTRNNSRVVAYDVEEKEISLDG